MAGFSIYALDKTKGFVIDNPGNVIFVPQDVNMKDDYSKAIINSATVETITYTDGITVANIADGNSFYPAGSRVTDKTGTIAIVFTSIDMNIINMVKGASISEATGKKGKLTKINESLPIDENGKITIKEVLLENTIIVKTASGEHLEKTTGTPTKSQFTVTTATTSTTFGFHDDLKEAVVILTYDYEAETIIYAMENRAMRKRKMIVSNTISDMAENERRVNNLIFSQVGSDAETVITMGKDPTTTMTITLRTYAPLPGQKSIAHVIGKNPIAIGDSGEIYL